MRFHAGGKVCCAVVLRALCMDKDAQDAGRMHDNDMWGLAKP